MKQIDKTILNAMLLAGGVSASFFSGMAHRIVALLCVVSLYDFLNWKMSGLTPFMSFLVFELLVVMCLASFAFHVNPMGRSAFPALFLLSMISAGYTGRYFDRRVNRCNVRRRASGVGGQQGESE